MAEGIADVDEWDSMPDPGGIRRGTWSYGLDRVPLVYYSSSEALDEYWESNSLSCWSEQGHDGDEGCCCRDGDYRPQRDDKPRRRVCNCAIGNQVNVYYDDHRQGCRVDNGRRTNASKKPQTTPKERGSDKRRGMPPMEDVIYYLAKRQRHRNDEQKRIRDWLRVMGGLEEEGGFDERRKSARSGERQRREQERRPRYMMSGGRSMGDEGEGRGCCRKVRFSQ
ncbi:hypothetical protein FZEAL_486 [Fusarium zealandicum]|uniref:Uncharacterized protein n=1 Tax=Fusarium zealandicum TaxID=1053134 RepID=A0A8H4UUK0_9HYPO|nr:hypothetical protein FZEAL_486 [Fusarium zealandicum]